MSSSVCVSCFGGGEEVVRAEVFWPNAYLGLGGVFKYF